MVCCDFLLWGLYKLKLVQVSSTGVTSVLLVIQLYRHGFWGMHYARWGGGVGNGKCVGNIKYDLFCIKRGGVGFFGRGVYGQKFSESSTNIQNISTTADTTTFLVPIDQSASQDKKSVCGKKKLTWKLIPRISWCTGNSFAWAAGGILEAKW
jgi:hypothetical protein